jgi:dTDP-4-dehydrorhamnose 3,5-epimerase
MDAHSDQTLPEVQIIRPRKMTDARGWFSETYNESDFARIGITCRFVQDNHSYSVEAGTLRGLHFQAPPFAQAKLVRCVRGAILDVIVDIRAGSPRYGQHASLELSRENGLMVFVPAGFAHGFLTLEKATEISYKVDAPYSAQHDRGLAFNDPTLAIAWPMREDKLILSDRDRAHPLFGGFQSPFQYEGDRP